MRFAREKASGIRMISPASKKTGIAMTRPVMARAHAAFLSPNLSTIVTASAWAPPDISKTEPNIEPSPTSKAMPFSVLPIPSSTAPMIWSNDIPAPRPISTAPTRMAIMAGSLNRMISASRTIRPMTAAMTSLVVSIV